MSFTRWLLVRIMVVMCRSCRGEMFGDSCKQLRGVADGAEGIADLVGDTRGQAPRELSFRDCA
jgi:hypothetical protein